MDEFEPKLRAISLIAIIALITIFIGSLLFLGNSVIGTAGTVGTFVFGIFSVYNHYFRLPEESSIDIPNEEIDDSITNGTKPKLGEQGFEINREDVALSELPPKRVAQVIYNSPNWHPDGHGMYSTWWRPRLRKLFHSNVFSNNAFEISLLGLTVGSYVMLYFVFMSFFPADLLLGVLEPLTEVYPSSVDTRSTQFVVFVSIITSILGSAYFEIKSNSTCPVCQKPFSLKSKKRYFKPENREVRTVSKDQGQDRIEVTYGVHIFQCESCATWHVISDDWERKLS